MESAVSSALGTPAVLAGLPGFGRGDLAQVGLDEVLDLPRDLRSGCVTTVGDVDLVGLVEVVDVVLADGAVALVGGEGRAVGGEPFLGGGVLFGFVIVGVTLGEDVLGDFAVGRVTAP